VDGAEIKIGCRGDVVSMGEVRLCVCFLLFGFGKVISVCSFFYFLFPFPFSTFSHGSIFLSYSFSSGLRFVLLSSLLLFQVEFFALLELLAWW
jgi:hypothetical protein